MGFNELTKGRFQGAAVTGVVASVIFATLYSLVRRQFEKEHEEDQEMMFDLLDEVWEYRAQQKKTAEEPKAEPQKKADVKVCPYCGSSF